MGGGDWSALFFLMFLGAVILTPIVLRNRLLVKQQEALAAALQQGIDPERIRESLALRRDDDDINGNWKAGQLLVVLGWAYLPFGVFAMLAGLAGEDASIGAVCALLPGVISLVLGARLLHIHRTIIGEVVKRGAAQPAGLAQAAAPTQLPQGQ